MSAKVATKLTTHQLSEAQQDDADQKERERLDRKELKRLKAFTAQLTQDAAAAIVAISPDDWDKAQAQDVEENAKKLATAD